jgi:hypothetical protein
MVEQDAVRRIVRRYRNQYNYQATFSAALQSPRPSPRLRDDIYLDNARHGPFDVALLMEVIEHLDVDRLAALVRVVWEFARPRRVIVTTPNAEYNSVWPALPAGKFRHPDHRFEWTRTEFQAWAQTVAATHRYTVTFYGIGDNDPEERGTPTQMAVFDLI